MSKKVIELLNDALKKNETLFGFEMLPPLKGSGMEGIFNAVERVVEFEPAYINITNHREGLKITEDENGIPEYHLVRRRPGTVGIAAAIQRRFGIPTVPHLICGGMSKYDIEDELIDMFFLDLNNLLLLRGDKRHGEAEFIPHPQGHERALELVRQVEAMNHGIYIDNESTKSCKTNFCIGVAGYPETHEEAFSPREDILQLKRKVDAGAEYVVTQMFFDNDYYFEFVRNCREEGIDVPIIPGLKPMVTERQLTVLPETFSINIPEALRKAIRDCKGDRKKIKETGLEWTIAQSKELKKTGVPAIHYYTMSKTENIAMIARQVF